MNLLANIFFLFCVTFENEERTFSYYRHFGKKSEIFQYFSCQIQFDIFICCFFFKFRQFKIFDVSSCIDGMFDLSGNELYNQLHLCDHVMMNSAGIGFMIFLDRNRDVPPICMLNFLLTPQPLQLCHFIFHLPTTTIIPLSHSHSFQPF